MHGGTSHSPPPLSKHFRVPADWQGDSIWVYFQGIFRTAGIYVNGHYVQRHDCGYTSFGVRLDNITQLQYGDDSHNVLAIYVDAVSGSGWWYEGRL